MIPYSFALLAQPAVSLSDIPYSFALLAQPAVSLSDIPYSSLHSQNLRVCISNVRQHANGP